MKTRRPPLPPVPQRVAHSEPGCPVGTSGSGPSHAPTTAPSRSRLSSASGPRAGFTLLEVLVATTIMAIAVSGLLASLSTSLRVASRLTDYDRATLLAREKMDELLVNEKKIGRASCRERV